MKRRLKRTGIIIGALILVIAVIFFVVDRQVSPLLMNVASAEVKEKISQLANECVLGVMSRSSEYSDLVTLTTDDDGHVTYLSADSIRMNGIAYNASLAIQEELEKADRSRYIHSPGFSFRQRSLFGRGTDGQCAHTARGQRKHSV